MNAQAPPTTSQEIAAAPTERTATTTTTTSIPFVVKPRHRYRFALTFMATFILLLLAMFWVNIAGNSTGLFPSRRNPSMAERAWKTRRIDDAVRRAREPGVMIMGSSRVMQIQPAYVEGTQAAQVASPTPPAILSWAGNSTSQRFRLPLSSHGKASFQASARGGDRIVHLICASHLTLVLDAMR